METSVDWLGVQAHKNSQAAPRRSLSIFLADDNVDTVLTLATLLRDEGHAVHTCASGLVALEAIARYKPDVCILDIVMPGKSGFDIARDVLAMRLPKRPLLIAISAVYMKPTDQIMARVAGFDHFIAKPADPDRLFQILNEYADGELPPAA